LDPNLGAVFFIGGISASLDCRSQTHLGPFNWRHFSHLTSPAHKAKHLWSSSTFAELSIQFSSRQFFTPFKATVVLGSATSSYRVYPRSHEVPGQAVLAGPADVHDLYQATAALRHQKRTAAASRSHRVVPTHMILPESRSALSMYQSPGRSPGSAVKSTLLDNTLVQKADIQPDHDAAGE